MSDYAEAPRFEAYFQRVEGCTVLTWRAEHWDEVVEHSNEPVLIDVTSTPMVEIAQDAPIIACTAERTAQSEGRISIYRYDEGDNPTPYNVDHYRVLRGETIQSRSDFIEMVLACGTAADSNIRDYFSQNVFLIKEEHGPDHWLPYSDLPSSIRTKIQIE